MLTPFKPPRYFYLPAILLFISTVVHANTTFTSYTTERLTLVTDIHYNSAIELISNIEALHQVAPRYIAETAEVIPRVALKMLVFKQRKDFLSTIGRRHFAAVTQPGLTQILLVVGPDARGENLNSNTMHEYTHYLLRRRAIAFPQWYEEGLATILGNSKVKDDQIRVGGLPQPALTRQQLRRVKFANVAKPPDLFNASKQKLTEFYQQSSQWVHYFLFAQAKDTPNRRTQLQSYLNDSNRDIYQTLNTTPADLNRAIRRYLRNTPLPSASHTLEKTLLNAKTQRLSPNQALAWQAQAAEVLNPQKAAELYAHLATAFPQNHAWRSGLISSMTSLDVEAAEQALASWQHEAPQNPAAKVRQADLLTRRCSLDATLSCLPQWQQAALLLREALNANPDDIEAIFLLGLTELYTGKAGSAVNYLRIAYQRAPWSAKVNLHYGECLRLLGFSNARTHLNNAREWALEPGVRRLAEAALARTIQ